ncbi:ankyrin repeat domain-containing protein [Streptomyces sp. NPDC058394]|uniref:ankyrin repeat domain-containing protein n=1 Tax=Streptomyces sp. NPDC058394 TaxID=3346477 RepID=UPI0036524D39
MEMPPTHVALEQDRLEDLRDLLAAGADVHEEYAGFTLLHRAVDGEVDGHIQTGEPLHVDATALLLSQGADPARRSHCGSGLSAHHMAFVSRHWLAHALFEAWLAHCGDIKSDL